MFGGKQRGHSSFLLRFFLRRPAARAQGEGQAEARGGALGPGGVAEGAAAPYRLAQGRQPLGWQGFIDKVQPVRRTRKRRGGQKLLDSGSCVGIVSGVGGDGGGEAGPAPVL